MLAIAYADHPKVGAWMARIEARPAWKKVHG